MLLSLRHMGLSSHECLRRRHHALHQQKCAASWRSTQEFLTARAVWGGASGSPIGIAIRHPIFAVVAASAAAKVASTDGQSRSGKAKPSSRLRGPIVAMGRSARAEAGRSLSPHSFDDFLLPYSGTAMRSKWTWPYHCRKKRDARGGESRQREGAVTAFKTPLTTVKQRTVVRGRAQGSLPEKQAQPQGNRKQERPRSFGERARRGQRREKPPGIMSSGAFERGRERDPAAYLMCGGTTDASCRQYREGAKIKVSRREMTYSRKYLFICLLTCSGSNNGVQYTHRHTQAYASDVPTKYERPATRQTKRAVSKTNVPLQGIGLRGSRRTFFVIYILKSQLYFPDSPHTHTHSHTQLTTKRRTRTRQDKRGNVQRNTNKREGATQTT